MSQSLISCVNNCGNLVPAGSYMCDDCLAQWSPDFTYLNVPQGQPPMQNSTALQNANIIGLNDGGAQSNVYSVASVSSYPATLRNAPRSNIYDELTPPISPWTSQSLPDSSQYRGIFHTPLVDPSTQVNTRQLNLLQTGYQPQTYDAVIEQPGQPQDRSRIGTHPAGARGVCDLSVVPIIDQKFIPYVPETNGDRSNTARDANARSCIRVFRAHGKRSPTANLLACVACAKANTTCITSSLDIVPPLDYDCWDTGLAEIRSSQDLTFIDCCGISSCTVDVAINGAVTNNFITLDMIQLDLKTLHQRQASRISFPKIGIILDTMIPPSVPTTGIHIQVLCYRLVACINLIMRLDSSTIRIQLKHTQMAESIAIEVLHSLADECSRLWKDIDEELNRILTSPKTKDPLIRWLNEAAYGLGMLSTALSEFSMGSSDTFRPEMSIILDRLLFAAKARFALFLSQLQRYRDIGPTEFDRGSKLDVPDLPGIQVTFRNTSQTPLNDEDRCLEQIRSFRSILSPNTALQLTEPMEVDTVEIEVGIETLDLKIYEQEALISQTRSLLESQEAELARLLAKELPVVRPKVQVEDTSSLHSIPMDKLPSFTSEAQVVELRQVLSDGSIAQQGRPREDPKLDPVNPSPRQTISETVSRFPSSTTTLVCTKGNKTSESFPLENLSPPVKKRKHNSILSKHFLTSHRSAQIPDAPPSASGLAAEQDVGSKRISRRWSKIMAKLEGPPVSVDRPVSNTRMSHPNRETKIDVKSLIAAINKRLSIGPNMPNPSTLAAK